jgi:glycosyltransferase involved in cell wall biosynthesis
VDTSTLNAASLIEGRNKVKKLSVLTLIDMNPNKFGALEEYAFHLSKTLLENGHLGMVGFSDQPPEWLREKFKASHIEVLKINHRNGTSAFIRDMRKTIRKYGLNIIHATFYPFYSANLILSTIGTGCKLIYSDQESRISHPSKGPKNLLRFLRNKFYQRLFHAIIADAEFVRECQIRDFYTKPDKTFVIYNGVNLKRFAKADPVQRSEALKKLGVPVDASVIVSIAQCIKAKCLNYFIKAA